MRSFLPFRRCAAWLTAGVLLLGIIAAAWRLCRAKVSLQPVAPPSGSAPPSGFAGSASCRECHARFYELWSTSHHGLAMQPFTPDLARSQFTAPATEVTIGKNTSAAVLLSDHGGQVRQRGPEGQSDYPIAHVMGGKNVYYLLTPLERGRLQVLPVAYDVRRREWFDTAASAMRHFTGIPEQLLNWRDPLYTFNTSCYACHVSQLATNYDLKTDTYQTTWAEPGINCETCHGPSGKHVEVCKAATAGQTPADLKIIVTRAFTPEQHNASCASCHAKASVITDGFRPGDRFFDHFDLVTLESPDYYPDGCDLGENYTYTSWRMNPCANAGKLHCVQCHTSSGRYRFKGEQAGKACLPCHEARVKNATAHTRHKPDSTGNECVSCHMPTTEFARMRRSDHSMRPPRPAATIAFKSPNACNNCHGDRDAAWADGIVRQWHARDYQAPVLKRAGLVAAARQRDWSGLPEMLEYIADPRRDEVFAASLIRLLAACADGRKWPALHKAMKDPSPLVRSAAAVGLADCPEPAAAAALLAATGDEYRLVRIRAADALARYPLDQASPADRARLESASAELEQSLKNRPDDWASHYNLGNYYSDRGRLNLAVASYQIASKLRPDAVQPWVNAALVQARLGQSAAAAQSLDRALAIEPANAVANLNMGLLMAEQGDKRRAEQCLRAALKADPAMAQAAYNLAVLVAADRPAEAIELCKRAHQLRRDEPKYAYTLAFYLDQSGDRAQAVQMLNELLAKHPDYLAAYALLGGVHEQSGDIGQARAVYQRALARPELSDQDRRVLMAKLRSLPPADPR